MWNNSVTLTFRHTYGLDYLVTKVRLRISWVFTRVTLDVSVPSSHLAFLIIIIFASTKSEVNTMPTDVSKLRIKPVQLLIHMNPPNSIQ